MRVPLATVMRVARRLVVEACRLGVPLYVEVKSPGVLYIETSHGSDEYVVFPLLNPLGEDTSIVMGKPWDYVPIARVRVEDGDVRVLEERVDQVPYALATNPRVMPDYEADTWAQRLRLLPRMEPCGEPPEGFEGVRKCSGENPCVEAVVDDYGVAAWIDRCVGLFTDARPWQARLGLRPGPRTQPSP